MTLVIHTTHEPVSTLPDYLDLNRCFIRTVIPHIGRPAVVLDVACGIGTLARLLIAELERPLSSKVVGIDTSLDSLLLAREELASLTASAVQIRAAGDRLPIPSDSADVVLVGNAIHLFEDKARVLTELRRVLRPGGILACNTAFYEGSRPGEAGRFYDTWVKRALAEVKRRAEGRRPDRLREAGGRRPAANPSLSLEEYRSIVDECGFGILSLGERTLEMGREYLEAIGSYSEFASMQLRGYPVPLACEAFVSTVAPTLAEMGVATVPRRWLELVAVAH